MGVRDDFSGGQFGHDVAERDLVRAAELVDEALAGRLRWMVPHGYKLISVVGGKAILRAPVIWEAYRGRGMTRASDQPSFGNVAELRSLLEQALQHIGALSRTRRLRWSITMDDGSAPSNLSWTLTARLG